MACMRLAAVALVAASCAAVGAQPAAPALESLHIADVAATGLPGTELTVWVAAENSTRSLLVEARAADPDHVVVVAGAQPGAPRRVELDVNLGRRRAVLEARLAVVVSSDTASRRYNVRVLARLAGRSSWAHRHHPAGAAAEPVYLTYDDGPHPVQTPQVLDVLARHGARATFFVTGRAAAAHPDLIDRIVADGHSIANHTWSHPRASTITAAEFRDQLVRTQQLLGLHATACFRPPGFDMAPYVDDVLAELGLRRIMADVNPRDWQQPGVDALADRIVAGAAPGKVIVLHDGIDRLADQTAPALDQALARLRDSGLRFEPVC